MQEAAGIKGEGYSSLFRVELRGAGGFLTHGAKAFVCLH